MSNSIRFTKYHGTGNDFIVVDNRLYGLPRNDAERYAAWCSRRFGIGADGLIFLQQKPGCDFEMVYFNSDGKESSMCGNGGRCIMAFANHIGLVGAFARFVAIDGEHEAKALGKDLISLKMKDVSSYQSTERNVFVLDTGSPHYVAFVDDLAAVDVLAEGRAIRNSAPYRAGGINVNFVESLGGMDCKMATYERGVEAETYSCGTGVVAAGMAASLQKAAQATGKEHHRLMTKGGALQVAFERTQNGFENVWLTGNAVRVFDGTVDYD